jgi:hypothetical protein
MIDAFFLALFFFKDWLPCIMTVFDFGVVCICHV